MNNTERYLRQKHKVENTRASLSASLEEFDFLMERVRQLSSRLNDETKVLNELSESRQVKMQDETRMWIE